LSQKTLQAIGQVQRGGPDTDRPLQNLTQMLKMGGQGPEDSPGRFLGHSQTRKLKSQPLKILWGAGQGVQAGLDLGIGLPSENQAAQ
jgi:hypothetical protein